MGALDKLIEAVEAGDDRISSYLPAEHEALWPKFYKAMEGSLDAAFALHEALLPGWKPKMPANEWTPKSFAVRGPHIVDDPDADCSGWPEYSGIAETPARAWLLAILRAYRAQHEGQG